MDFTELLDQIKNRFPTKYDHDEACSFFDRIKSAEWKLALEVMKNKIGSRTFPTRPVLLKLMEENGIEVRGSEEGEVFWEYRCHGCNARRPLNYPKCSNCGMSDQSVVKARSQPKPEPQGPMATEREIQDTLKEIYAKLRDRPARVVKVSDWGRH